jgi:DNA excision repair protein ERCC-4
MTSTEPADSLNGVSEPLLPLPYQRLLLQTILTTDALLILARGLGLLTIVSHLLYHYDNPEIATAETDKVYKNFVVMIGAETREETLVGQNMAELVTTYGGAGTGLQVVNTDKVGVDQRCLLLLVILIIE